MQIMKGRSADSVGIGRTVVRGAALAFVLTAALCGCGREEGSKPAAQPATQEQQILRHLSHAPDDLQARLELANLYYDTGRPHLAIPEYQFVLKQRPDDPDVRTDLGTCYKRLDALAQARAEYEQVLRTHPEHVNAIYNLAVVAELAGDTERAIELWERVTKLAPDKPLAVMAMENAAAALEKLAAGTEPKSETGPETTIPSDQPAEEEKE